MTEAELFEAEGACIVWSPEGFVVVMGAEVAVGPFKTLGEAERWYAQGDGWVSIRREEREV